MTTLDTIINDWTNQRHALADLDEAEIKSLIALEMKGRARSSVIIPAHQRQSRLRTQRERSALKDRMEKRQAILAQNEQQNGARKKR